MFPKFVPVFSLDAAHFTSPTKGTLFAIYGSDVNKHQVLIELMLVADNEKASIWKLFIDFVTMAL